MDTAAGPNAEAIRAELERMVAELEDVAATLEGEHAGDSSELSHLDQHPADTASEISDLDRENAMLEATAARRLEVQEALARLAAGTYGRCVDCGTEISRPRLEIRPEAARCLECQQRFEHNAA